MKKLLIGGVVVAALASVFTLAVGVPPDTTFVTEAATNLGKGFAHTVNFAGTLMGGTGAAAHMGGEKLLATLA